MGKQERGSQQAGTCERLARPGGVAVIEQSHGGIPSTYSPGWRNPRALDARVFPRQSQKKTADT